MGPSRQPGWQPETCRERGRQDSWGGGLARQLPLLAQPRSSQAARASWLVAGLWSCGIVTVSELLVAVWGCRSSPEHCPQSALQKLLQSTQGEVDFGANIFMRNTIRLFSLPLWPLQPDTRKPHSSWPSLLPLFITEAGLQPSFLYFCPGRSSLVATVCLPSCPDCPVGLKAAQSIAPSQFPPHTPPHLSCTPAAYQILQPVSTLLRVGGPGC